MEISKGELIELENMILDHGKKYNKLMEMWEEAYKLKNLYRKMWEESKVKITELESVIIAQKAIIDSKPSRGQLSLINNKYDDCKQERSNLVNKINELQEQLGYVKNENTSLKEAVQELKKFHPDYSKIRIFIED